MIPSLITPIEVQSQLAQRFKMLRLSAGYKRSTLSKRAGVSESSLKRFENSGEISLRNLLRLTHSIGHLQDFNSLFQLPDATSLAELKENIEKKTPKRGRF
ncbi:Helix-turn-helix protein [Desulfocapsa sulfexigens DSM 10523]|uniref:Helix-turn-helix protein n=1 Tax=Desulfocapsa sulfexigens (strain DSM 10523 / SB164P1) TaxID=1167006 RepID=M1PK27_DESSD|nr:helix-turn-helix domain-containing protein [Desulfocapsa sulfexigens]AGF79895.1 Helix-turn-helix protein [Desulfocapsa sulfexigens DSM 10523]